MEEKHPLGNLNPKRILAIDMVRGIGIFGVLFIHPMIYGVWHSEALALSIMSSWTVALFAPLIIVATWGGGFPMISAFLRTFEQQDPFLTNAPVILLSVVIFEGFWIILSIGWEKIGYKYGFEYWIARVMAKHQKAPFLGLTMTDQTEYFNCSRTTPVK